MSSLHSNGHWGDDAPVLGPDNKQTVKGRKVLGEDTYRLVGTFCAAGKCTGVNGKHEPGCGKNN